MSSSVEDNLPKPAGIETPDNSDAAAKNDQPTMQLTFTPDGISQISYRWQSSADGRNWTSIPGSASNARLLTRQADHDLSLTLALSCVFIDSALSAIAAYAAPMPALAPKPAGSRDSGPTAEIPAETTWADHHTSSDGEQTTEIIYDAAPTIGAYDNGGQLLELSPENHAARGSEAMYAARYVFLSISIFSFVLNLLMLVSPFYMLQVYDRVLTSRSKDTLYVLSLLAVGLIGISAMLEFVRGRILVRLGATLDRHVTHDLFAALMEDRIATRRSTGSQPIRDLETLRGFLTGPGLLAFFDAPWVPLCLFRQGDRPARHLFGHRQIRPAAAADCHARLRGVSGHRRRDKRRRDDRVVDRHGPGARAGRGLDRALALIHLRPVGL